MRLAVLATLVILFWTTATGLAQHPPGGDAGLVSIDVTIDGVRPAAYRVPSFDDQAAVLSIEAYWDPEDRPSCPVPVGSHCSEYLIVRLQPESVLRLSPTDGIALFPIVSGDGSTFVFGTNASLLPEDDKNEAFDVYASELEQGSYELVSGSPANGQRPEPPPSENIDTRDYRISYRGNVVVFESQSPYLVPEDFNQRVDLFRHDRSTGRTNRISMTTTGNESDGDSRLFGRDAMSADGRWTLFGNSGGNMHPALSGCPGEHPIATMFCWHAYAYDHLGNRSILLDTTPSGLPSNKGASPAAVARDGMYAFFLSKSTDILPGANGFTQLYRSNLEAGTIDRISVNNEGRAAGHDVSGVYVDASGRFVMFSTGATNMGTGLDSADSTTYVRDLLHSRTLLVRHPEGPVQVLSISLFGSDPPKLLFDLATSDGQRYSAVAPDARTMMVDFDAELQTTPALGIAGALIGATAALVAAAANGSSRWRRGRDRLASRPAR